MLNCYTFLICIAESANQKFSCKLCPVCESFLSTWKMTMANICLLSCPLHAEDPSLLNNSGQTIIMIISEIITRKATEIRIDNSKAVWF